MKNNGALFTLVEREISPGVKMTRYYVNPGALCCLMAIIQGRSVAERQLGFEALEVASAVAEESLKSV